MALRVEVAIDGGTAQAGECGATWTTCWPLVADRFRAADPSWVRCAAFRSTARHRREALAPQDREDLGRTNPQQVRGCRHTDDENENASNEVARGRKGPGPGPEAVGPPPCRGRTAAPTAFHGEPPGISSWAHIYLWFVVGGFIAGVDPSAPPCSVGTAAPCRRRRCRRRCEAVGFASAGGSDFASDRRERASNGEWS